jgi:iron-sulfur cluster assembly protein
MAVTLTEAAARHVVNSLSKRGKGEGLRVGVRKSGCSGLAYVVEYVDVLSAEDEVFETHGVKVFVDRRSLVYLDGTEVDYRKEGLNQGFRFSNPNTRSQCGCGESFSVA